MTLLGCLAMGRVLCVWERPSRLMLSVRTHSLGALFQMQLVADVLPGAVRAAKQSVCDSGSEFDCTTHPLDSLDFVRGMGLLEKEILPMPIPQARLLI